ncbi:helix-turn-helix transcriptional regulator [Flavobacterium sp.]|uniref:helix-turn-helix transcriptional regulator n=1 Tax=Flavobacterium sp. TaxID=239 RepID=UPI003752AFA7
MVNTDDFIKRLEILFDYYTISSSSFADKIGVQRSSLSHLLSGRNKPSLDLILKIIAVFPEVDLYWILNGKGSFPKNNNSENIISDAKKTETSTLFNFPTEDIEELKKVKKSDIEENVIESKLDNNSYSSKIVDKIVFFYTDGSFKEYIR